MTNTQPYSFTLKGERYTYPLPIPVYEKMKELEAELVAMNKTQIKEMEFSEQFKID